MLLKKKEKIALILFISSVSFPKPIILNNTVSIRKRETQRPENNVQLRKRLKSKLELKAPKNAEWGILSPIYGLRILSMCCAGLAVGKQKVYM
jgi:hypothetical protein